MASAGVAAGYLHPPAAAQQRFQNVSRLQLLEELAAEGDRSILFGEGAEQWLLQRSTDGGLQMLPWFLYMLFQLKPKLQLFM